VTLTVCNSIGRSYVAQCSFNNLWI
jgi:hypothetical protein